MTRYYTHVLDAENAPTAEDMTAADFHLFEADRRAWSRNPSSCDWVQPVERAS